IFSFKGFKVRLCSEYTNFRNSTNINHNIHLYIFVLPSYIRDTRLKSAVHRIFGDEILRYSEALCHGHYYYLDRLPDEILLKIINYLELEDVGHLARTSHRFRQLCGSEHFLSFQTTSSHQLTHLNTAVQVQRQDPERGQRGPSPHVPNASSLGSLIHMTP
uniref:F-box domain-containing protein n=1 Tax=Monopterus albus TaxID=43700 RepID=A0A3Q3KBE6_MONAL